MARKRNTGRRSATLLALLLGWFGVSNAHAQDFCTDLRAVLAAASTEFAGMTGGAMAGSWPSHLSVFSGTQVMGDANACAVAQQQVNGRRYSTSYTCSNAASDDAAGIRQLLERVGACIEVTTWSEQSDSGARLAQYGLLRLSVTRNGARGGLALGVEAFRDERGEVMGSPVRGDVVDANGVHRCTAKTPQQIVDYLTMYNQRPGAERFETDEFIGFTNRINQPVVAFVTRPVHPAHPAIIVRRTFERDGNAYISAGGDFAGDCEAFHALLQQVRQMNENLRPQQ